MHATDAIKTALAGTQNLLTMYLSDLADSDLLIRPAPKANHIAWQLGHVISSEQKLVLSQIPDARYPALPAGFDKQHSKDTAAVDPPRGFLTKGQYVDLFNQTRQATIATLERLTDEDLSKPSTGQMAPFAPTLGAFLLLVSNHTLMHAGQFTVVRRKLDKPVLF